MLGFSELPPATRRNLILESFYAATAGVVSGLALLAQVTVIGSLTGGMAAVTVLAAAQPASNIFQPLWAAAARRWRLQGLALFSGVLRCFPLLLIGWVADAWVFTALVVAFYVLSGPITLAVPTLYKYNYPDSHRGRIIGFLRMIQQSFAMLAMLGSAYLLDQERTLLQVLYPVGGAISIAGLFFYSCLRIPNDIPGERRRLSERPTLANLRAVLQVDYKFRLFQSTIFLTGAGFMMSRAVWLYLLRDHFQLSQFWLSFLVQVLPIILGAITSPAWGMLIDRTSPVAGRLAFAWMGIFAYAALFGSFYFHWLVLGFVGAILRGLVLGAAEVATTAGNLYFAIRPERAALYESVSSIFQGARGLIMPMLGWLLFAQIGVFLFLVPTAMNAWSLWIAYKLWRLDRMEPPTARLSIEPESADVTEEA